MLFNCQIYPISLDSELTLKAFSAQYSAKFLAFIVANRAHLERYDAFETQLQTIDDVNQTLSQVDRLRNEGRSLSCTIWRDNHIIGFVNCGLDPVARTIRIGYGLSQSEQGRGIITRTAQLLLNHAFTNFNMQSAWLECWVSNVDSQRVAERLGFHREATLAADPAKGIMEQQYRYTLDRPI